MNKISSVTRRTIFDYIQLENILWAGRLEEVDFLSRIYDLKNIKSTDSRFENAEGDIWQHRVNNDDWEDGWIFSDSRFNLLNCDDSVFLNFLCEMVHPLVRDNKKELDKLISIFNQNLKEDGFEIVETMRISNKPVFNGQAKFIINDLIMKRGSEIGTLFNAEYVAQQINLMESSIESSPHVAIGVAKELIETACKSIFLDMDEELDKNLDLSKLVKETAKLLKLTPDDILEEVKAVKSIKQILGSLSAIIQGIAEVRNEYGSGHGKNSSFKGLQPRHARLAVGASTTLAVYLVETHQLRQSKE